MTALLYTVGIVLFLVGISASIALHELGHLVPAKRFGVKVTRYMIGFGPTLFSTRRGETEYGIKALPLGGYIAMPGMYPPEEQADTRLGGGRRRRRRRARLFATAVEDARIMSNEDLDPGEEDRAFYSLSVPKRLVVMFGGPFVNLVLGIVALGVSLVGIGLPGPTTTVETVVECAVPATTAAQRTEAQQAECQPGDQLTPAWETGIEPGDTIVSVDGTEVEDWDAMVDVIRDSAGTTVPIVLERDGERRTLDVPIISSERPALDEDGDAVYDEAGALVTEPAGFLGIGPTQEYIPISPLEFPGHAARAVGDTFHALLTLPQKLVDIAQVAFTDEPRDPEGPMGMVGVGRVAGEIASTNEVETAGGDVITLELIDKAQTGISLFASLNLFLFAFNMVPLLPLDGGHIAVALYEGARRRISRWRGRGAVGPFDTARLLPLTYVVIAGFLAMTLLLVYVDIVKPVRLFGA